MPKRGRRRSDDPEWMRQVDAVKEGILLGLGAQFDSARVGRAWSVLEASRHARLSKTQLQELLKTEANPTLTTLIAVALALGGSLEITFHPGPQQP